MRLRRISTAFPSRSTSSRTVSKPLPCRREAPPHQHDRSSDRLHTRSGAVRLAPRYPATRRNRSGGGVRVPPGGGTLALLSVRRSPFGARHSHRRGATLL